MGATTGYEEPNVSNIGKEMASQSNRGTQYPLFIVEEDNKELVSWHDYDERERVDSDYRERVEEYLCTTCSRKYKINGYESLPDECDECQPEAFDYYKVTSEYALDAGVFFTAKACQEHIELNHYHYINPRVYCISAWRNGEMQEVMQHLINESGEPVPRHYQ